MKKSRRYLRATILTLLAIQVLYVGLNRLYAVTTPAPAPARTPVADLAALRNFTAIEVRGDFNLELMQQSDYALEYVPLSAAHGEFSAKVEADTLILSGFGNRSAVNTALVRIGLPALRRLDVSFSPAVTLLNFSGDRLDLQLTAIEVVTLKDNNIEHLRMKALGVREVNLDEDSFRRSKLHIAGETSINITD